MNDGYDTQVGEQGVSALSAGQAQRVALARALYGETVSSSSSTSRTPISTPEGDEALTRAVRAARERRAIVVVVAHRPIGIEAVDMPFLVLKSGRCRLRPQRTRCWTGPAAGAPPVPPIKIVVRGGCKNHGRRRR